MASHQKQLQKLYSEIEKHYMPQKGWCDVEWCTACARAELQVDAAKEAAAKGFSLNQPAAALKPAEHAAQRQSFEQGYDRGRTVALQEAHQWAAQSAQRAEVAAKSKWYQKGLREGRQMAQLATTTADPQAARGKLMESVLQECRVIGESNPQMNPAMNALRHRLKKIN